MTPDEIRLWQSVFLARMEWPSVRHGECAEYANWALREFRKANKREPTPREGTL